MNLSQYGRHTLIKRSLRPALNFSPRVSISQRNVVPGHQDCVDQRTKRRAFINEVFDCSSAGIRAGRTVIQLLPNRQYQTGGPHLPAVWEMWERPADSYVCSALRDTRMELGQCPGVCVYAALTDTRPGREERDLPRMTISTSQLNAVTNPIRRSTENPSNL